MYCPTVGSRSTSSRVHSMYRDATGLASAVVPLDVQPAAQPDPLPPVRPTPVRERHRRPVATCPLSLRGTPWTLKRRRQTTLPGVTDLPPAGCTRDRSGRAASSPVAEDRRPDGTTGIRKAPAPFPASASDAFRAMRLTHAGALASSGLAVNQKGSLQKGAMGSHPHCSKLLFRSLAPQPNPAHPPRSVPSPRPPPRPQNSAVPGDGALARRHAGCLPALRADVRRARHSLLHR